MIVVGYEIKVTHLSRLSLDPISTEERKAFHFQEGLSQFFKDKLLLHKLEM